MNRPIVVISRILWTTILVAIGVVSFVFNVSMGAAPRIDSESSWTEVLAWGAINHLQWGKDIVYTYGPLGFLTPYYHHVSGAFAPFIVGQMLLAAAFSFAVVGLLRRESATMLVYFALAFVCALPWMRGDTAWLLTLLFGATALIAGGKNHLSPTRQILLVLFALVSAAIAQIKFSIFPIWLLCVLALAVQGRRWWHVIAIATIFLAAFLAVWLVAGQALSNLPAYLRISFEIAAGYGHAMGLSTDPVIECLGILCTLWFGLICLCALWHFRRDVPNAALVAMYAAAGLLLWRANFTRADHAPWFFGCYALMPIGLLCHQRFANKLWRNCLVGLAVISAAVSLYGNDLPVWWQARPGIVVNPATRFTQNWMALANTLRANASFLTNLSDRQDVLAQAWTAAAKDNDLPLTRAHIGKASVDVFTIDQGIALLNQFNYSPRPIFQSYVAYTPELARLNESHFLGSIAPKFVLLRLEAIDNRLPMSEDGLALIALLTHYRPVMKENGFLLLQRDESVGATTAITPRPNNATVQQVGADFPINIVDSPVIAFIHLDLNWLGQLYALLVREPNLTIALSTDDGKTITHRLIRPTASSGFLISPIVESTSDWTKLYLSTPLPKSRSFRVDVEHAWERVFFGNMIEVELRPLNVLHGDLKTMPEETRKSLNIYPGFNLMPIFVQGYTHTYQEDGRDSAGFQTPASLAFEPSPGNYDVNAVFGVQGGALNTGCLKASPDGVGISLILHHGGNNIVLWHGEVDPFHVEHDKGPQKLDVDGVKVERDDAVEFFIDPGHGGNNQACDWAYVRDLTFAPR